MTPAARVQAAIECLDRILAGDPAERVLTGWARGARYAGSKDRAAVRDHVYDVLRNRRRCARYGGGETGRRLMLGWIAASGVAPQELFTGEGHAPPVLTDAERAQLDGVVADEGFVAELPDWLAERLHGRLGDAYAAELAPLTERARIELRVNLRKSDRSRAIAALAIDGIVAAPLEGSETALQVTEGARALRNSAAYRDGLVELQGVASQAAMETLPLRPGMRVLDYCAGGGGKTLAMAGRAAAAFFAHDAIASRLRDLPVRADRAGVDVTVLGGDQLSGHAPFDLVLCDVPCSGSGTWRRDPDAKWRFTRDRLAELNAVQDGILDRAAGIVKAGGLLAYATCSILDEENGDRVAGFLSRRNGWRLECARHWRLRDGGDGFYIAHLKREN